MKQSFLTLLLLSACSFPSDKPALSGPEPAFHPGDRVLMDAHNAYPEDGLYADRLARALGTGTPVAIEQDLYLRTGGDGTTPTVVVGHDDRHLESAPSLEDYFFRQITPLMDSALASGERTHWPLVVLNLDFKKSDPALHQALWALLRKYERFLTTARKLENQAIDTLSTGPLLVLTGTDSVQRHSYYTALPEGEKLLLFGAVPVASPAGDTDEQRAENVMKMSADELITAGYDNYARWVNFPWHVIEQGGPQHASEWTSADSARLSNFVEYAHSRKLWIRFYTLDGYTAETDRGYIADYNFGSLVEVQKRWNAATAAGVDFIATDQYDEFALWRRGDTTAGQPPITTAVNASPVAVSGKEPTR